MRAIDADRLIEDILSKAENARYICPDDYEEDNPLSVIDEQPTIEMPEIIRCKDCVKAKDYGYGILWCERLLGTFRVNPDDFCSYGERREE